MKKILSFVAIITLILGVNAQTIVSTQPQKRNAVIEEYTGVNCTYCPDGHRIVQEFADANPGKVVPINIHVGYYAAKYTTQWGSAIEGQTDISGYPAGSVNRLKSECKIHAYTRGEWASTGDSILNLNSPVNVAATAEVDATTRTMTIHVEVYYTDDVEQDNQLLNIVLLQNNIIGTQTGMNYNPAQVTGDGKYIHNHMLRDMITGQWGEEIANNTTGKITTGTFIEKDYTYNIPEIISNESVLMGDIDLAIFITDGKDASCPSLKGPNIWTGITVQPTYTGISGLDANIVSVNTNNIFGCQDLTEVSVNVRNTASELNTIKFEYTNTSTNDTKIYNWTGNLGTFASTTITFPEKISATTGQKETINVKILELNGESINSTIQQGGISNKPDIKTGNGNPILVLKKDKYASECTWKIYNSNNEIVQQGGPYADNAEGRDTIKLSQILYNGCYTFEILDSYGDGMQNGQYKILDSEGTVLVSNVLGNWGRGEKKDFRLEGLNIGLDNVEDGNIYQAIVYPNPAKDIATLSVYVGNSDVAQIRIIDINGRIVKTLNKVNLLRGNNNIEINTSDFTNGVYYINVITPNGNTVNKLSVLK